MTTPLRIGLLLYPGCLPAGLLAFADLLHAANRRAGQMQFSLCRVALQVGPVNCASGVILQAEQALEDTPLDGLLLPGCWAESVAQVEELLQAQSSLMSALACLRPQVRLWSYCVGVALHAGSGRLDGQAATVTWWLVDALRQRFPRVRWQVDRDCMLQDREGTATGVNGYQALAQVLIEHALGAGVWRDIEALMVLARPPRAHPVFASMRLIEQAGPLLRRLHGLVEQWPAERLTVQRLADALAVAPRTLARHVQRDSGLAVAELIRRIKLHQVSERLLCTSAPLSHICAELGFSSEASLRRMFKGCTALTPQQYRQRYAHH